MDIWTYGVVDCHLLDGSITNYVCFLYSFSNSWCKSVAYSLRHNSQSVIVYSQPGIWTRTNPYYSVSQSDGKEGRGRGEREREREKEREREREREKEPKEATKLNPEWLPSV